MRVKAVETYRGQTVLILPSCFKKSIYICLNHSNTHLSIIRTQLYNYFPWRQGLCVQLMFPRRKKKSFNSTYQLCGIYLNRQTTYCFTEDCLILSLLNNRSNWTGTIFGQSWKSQDCSKRRINKFQLTT